MRQSIKNTVAAPPVGPVPCGLSLGEPAPRARALAKPLNPRIAADWAQRRPLCRPAQRGAEGAGKTVVTDYRFTGPGYATRKPIGWGEPQTPPAPRFGGATA